MQQKLSRKRRILSFLLAFLLAFTGIPMERIQAEPAPWAEDANLLARYPLAQDANDISGNHKNGEVHGSVTWNEGLTLPGGKKTSAADASYVTLPGDLFAGRENLTISVWIKSATNKGNYAALFFGTAPQSNNMPLNYWLFNPTNPSGLFKSVFTDSNNSGTPYNTEKGVTAGGTEVYKGKWVHYTTVLTEKSVTGYINGQRIGEAAKSKKVADFGSGIQAYIGRSNYLEDMTYAASFQDLQVYGSAMSDDQVRGLYFDTAQVGQEVQESILPEIANQLSLSAQTDNGVVMEAKKLELPTQLYGATIQWASDKENVISADGQVALPEQQEVVTLTATLTLGSATAAKAFQITVLPAGGSLNYVAEHLQIPYVLDASTALPVQSGDVSISWSGSDAVQNNGQIAPNFDGKQEIALKATLSSGGQKLEKEFQCLLFGRDAVYVQSYTRNTSGDMVNKLARSMFLAFSENGRDNFEALNDDYGILFMRAESAENGVLTPKGLKHPYLFYTKDGKYGVVAVRTAENGSADPAKASSVMFYTSEDLVNYDEVGFVDLHTKASVNEPVCEYDPNAGVYRISWNDGAGNYFQNTLPDIQAGSQASQPQGTLPVSIRRVQMGLSGTNPGNLLPMEYDKGIKLRNKLGVLINTDVTVPDTVYARTAEDVESVRATAYYNDGSTASKKVVWDLSDVDFNTPGSYRAEGKVTQPTFHNSSPLFNARPDPEMVKYNGKFYFISTDEGGQGRIYIRESDTLEGIKNSSETLLLDGNSYPSLFKACLWAPELHVIEGRLYVFFAGSMTDWSGVQSHVMRLKEGGDPKKTADWETPIRVLDKDGKNLYDANTQGITLDMTYFEVGEQSYVCWAQRQRHPVDNGSWLYIATVNKKEPWKLTSDRVCICKPDYGWDNNNTFVVEGPFALQRDGKIYLTFSGGATDHTYCVGVMTAMQGSNLLDAASWRKSNFPIFTSWSVPNQYGPGHNAYIYDDDGTVYNTYHAKWGHNATRSASIRRVHFDIDGDPVLDLVEERDLLEKFRKQTFEMQVEVLGASYDAKEELQSVYDLYKDITAKPAEVSETDWAAFTEALNHAKNLLAQASPAEKDLMAAGSSLKAAAKKVVAIVQVEITNEPAKKTYRLGEALDTAGLRVSAVDGKGGKHTLGKGEYAISGFDSGTVGKKTVTVSYQSLKATFQVTVTAADKSALQAAIAKAESLKAEEYAAESWAKLSAALDKAKAAASKADALQSELDEAQKALEAAMNGLVPASALAYFTFDQEAQDGKFTSGNTVAAVQGSVALQERDAENGKALYLDGSASYLDLKKTDGSSLLTGLQEITISYDAKPGRTDTNWGFFAAPNTTKQEYEKEHYIGALINGGKTTIERYNNNGPRPTNISAATGTDWVHVDVVLKKDATILYVDGLKQGVQASSYSLPDILGQNSIFQIGKANWGDSGEYSKMWIDNFTIYGSALTDADLIDPEKARPLVQAAKEALTIPGQQTVDFALPQEGSNSTEISWNVKGSSSNLSIQDGIAKVTRPARGQQDAKVTLVATIQLGSVKESKEFTITIPALSAEDVKAGIVIPRYITGDLPSEVNGEKVTWNCDVQGFVSAEGKVTLPDSTKGSQKVKLTASMGANISVTGEAEILAYGGSVLTYVTKGADLLAYADSRRTDALYVAARTDANGQYEPLNKGKAILYVKWNGSQKDYPHRQMGSPSFFRTAEGALGVIASANNSTDSIYLWDTKDMVSFTNERTIKLNEGGMAVQDPRMVYDSASGKYKVFWKNENGASYLTTLDNLKDAPKAGSTIACSYPQAGAVAAAKAPANADVAQAFEFVMSPKEYQAFTRKYGTLHNTGMKSVNVQAKAGEQVKMPETVTAEYSDGSAKELGVIWNQEDLAKLKTAKAGVYEVKGEVQQDAYAYPFISERADPHIFYNEDDGYYYSTGSYYEANMTSNNVAQSYRKLDIRRAKTIAGLKTAEEHYIRESKVGDRWGGFFWAPEFHKINGTWYCLVGAHDFGSGGITNNTNWNNINWCSNSILIPYVGDGDNSTSIEEDIKAGGMLDASQWGEPIILDLPSNANAAFDVSYYEAENGQGYYIIPRNANLLIIKVKGGNGVVPQAEGNAATLKGLQWPWEYGIFEGSVTVDNPKGNDQGIVEGPYLFEYGDKVYISYSGATVDKYYCLGLMMADKGSDLMDPASWTQLPYPALSSYDTYEGQIGGGAHVGGGHNSIVLDEYGNLALVYHARPYPDPHEGMSGAGGLFDPCRHTVVKSINVAYDGTLIFNMTAEEELASSNKTVTATVTITGSQEPPADKQVEKVTLNKTALTLTQGKSAALKATVTPSDAKDKSLTWKSSNEKVAKVSQSGKVTAIKAGTATITVTSVNGKKAACKVTVKAARIAVKSVKLNLKKATVGKGEKITLKATVSPSNATSKKVTWKSSKTSVAKVSSKGVVTARKGGTATITATADGKKATCKITVKAAPKKITLAASKKTIKRKKTFQIKVKLPKNTASYKMTYSTSNKKVATVSSSGKVKGLKKGTAVITVKTFNGKKAKIKITVK